MGAAWWVVVLGCAGAAFAACDGSVEVDPTDSAESEATAASSGGMGSSTSSAGATGARGGSSSVGAAGGGCPIVECVPVRFSSETQCNDCIDNDGDGLIDLEEPSCVGPWALDETTFVTAIGDDVDPCRTDCAFDASFGAGDDECNFHLACDPLTPLGCVTPPPVGCPRAQDPECLDFCGSISPNGCDCAGCCELPARSGNFVMTDTPACMVSATGEPMSCDPCTPHVECMNPCDECEICLGERAPPDGCVVQACPVGRSPCGQPCQLACGPDEYCLTGCCSADPSL
jgi:hypothetical protein